MSETMKPTRKSPRLFYGWFVVMAAFFIILLSHGTRFSFGVFFMPVLTEFGWTRAITSGAYSVHLFGQGIFSIFAGRLNDKFGPRAVLTVCSLFLGMGYMLASQISAVWQLYLYYGLLVAVGMSGIFVPLQSTIARWFVKRRALMTGVVMSGIGVGTFLIPPLASYIISAYGWRTSYVIVGGTLLVLTISAAQFLRRDPSQVGQLPYGQGGQKTGGLDIQKTGIPIGQAIQTVQFWILCLAQFIFSLTVHAIMVHIDPYAITLGTSATVAASMLAVIGGVSVVSRVLAGAVADSIGYKRTLLIGFSVMFIALLWLQVANQAWTLYLFAVIFGFAYGGIGVLFSPLLAELFGLGSHGVILAVNTLGYTVGGALGPILLGYMFDTVGNYKMAFLVCALLSAVALTLSVFLRSFTTKTQRGA